MSGTQATGAGLCVLRHQKGRRPVATVGTVCDSHLADLRDLLADVSELWEILPWVNQVLSTPAPGNPEAKPTRQAHPPAPVNLAYLALLDPATRPLGEVEVNEWRNGPDGSSNGAEIPRAFALLSGWCRRVHDGRRGGREFVGDVGDVPELVAYLRRHLLWIVEQEWLEEFQQQLRMLRSALLSATGESPGPQPLADCPYCGTALYTDHDAEVRRLRRQGEFSSADIRARSDFVKCPSCRTVWDGWPALRRLALIAEQD